MAMSSASANQDAEPSCPFWCSGEHDELAAETERCHATEARRFLCLALNRVPVGAGYKLARHPEPRELEIQRFKFLDDGHEWVYIGDGHHYLELSLDSAKLLVQEMSRLIRP